MRTAMVKLKKLNEVTDLQMFSYGIDFLATTQLEKRCHKDSEALRTTK